MTTATTRSHARRDTLHGPAAAAMVSVICAVGARTKALGGWRAEADATYCELGDLRKQEKP